MLRLSNKIFGFRSSKKRKSTWYLEQLICLIFAVTLTAMFFLGGGGAAEDQLILIPLFSALVLLHGLSIFLKCNPNRPGRTFDINCLALIFLPFIFWLLLNSNFLSITPWRAQIDLFIFIEAWIILWIAANHISKFRDLRMVFGMFLIVFLLHLYVGYDQFFHGKSISELGVQKKITGLFRDSSSFVFSVSLFLAVALPLARLRYWKLVKRYLIAVLFLFGFFAIIFSHNLQGYGLLLIALISGCFFTPFKLFKQISFVLSAIVIAGLTYAVLSAWVPAFGDYFFSTFRFEGVSYGLSVFYVSCLLFLSHALWGVGLAAFSDQVLKIESTTFPLLVEDPQNFYLLSLSELGLIGFLALMIPIFVIGSQAWNQLQQTPKKTLVDGHRRVLSARFYLSASGAFLLSFALGSVFHPLVKYPLFLCLFALVLRIVSFDQTKAVLSLKKSNKLRIVYPIVTILFAGFFVYDGYRVFKSQIYLELATQRMDKTVFSGESFEAVEISELIDVVDRAIQYNRENLDAWLLKSTLLNARYNHNPIRYEKDRVGMLEVTQFALDRQKKHWEIWLSYGISLAVNGEFESAEQALLRAQKLAPKSFDANFYIAFYYYQFSQDYDQSQMYLDKALALQPNNQEARELLRKLNL